MAKRGATACAINGLCLLAAHRESGRTAKIAARSWGETDYGRRAGLDWKLRSFVADRDVQHHHPRNGVHLLPPQSRINPAGLVVMLDAGPAEP